MIQALMNFWESLFPEPVTVLRHRPSVLTSPCLFTRLGLTFEARQSEVESAYKAAKEKFKDPQQRKLIDEAYQVLCDPDKRQILLLVRRGLAAYCGVAPNAVTMRHAAVVYDSGPFRITKRV